MLSILIALRDLRFALPAGFMLAVVPPVVSTWAVVRLSTHALRFLLSPLSSSSSSAFCSKLHRLSDDIVYSLYSRLTVFFFETCSCVELVFYGDMNTLMAASSTENVLFLCNHQTTADWMIVNMLAARVNDWPGPLGHIRYVMKGGLKFLPLIGFYLGTYARGGVFVKRTRDGRRRNRPSNGFNDDIKSVDGSKTSQVDPSPSSLTPESSLEKEDNYSTVFRDDSLSSATPRSCDPVNSRSNNKTLRSLDRIRRWKTENGVATWLVVYPEGTRFDPDDRNKIDKSRRYAEVNGLKPLEHVLCPRAKAVRDSLMILGSSLDAVYHVTIAYSSTFDADSTAGVSNRLKAPSMSEILMGANPRVHLHLKRIQAKDLPADLTRKESSVRDWLYSLFAESDDRLRGFYSLDPGKRGKLLSSFSSSSNVIRFAESSLSKTLPAFVAFSLVMLAVLSTKRGRRLYWQSWLIGSPALAALGALIY